MEKQNVGQPYNEVPFNNKTDKLNETGYNKDEP